MSDADEINRLRKSRDYWVRQAMAFSEHADNMRLALMEQADVVRREDVVAGRAASAHDLLAALKKAVDVMQDYDIDEHLSGEFEVFTDAIAKAEGRGHE
jgi:hypothetical protein